MSTKPFAMLLALAVVCMAAVAWAADAPSTATASSSHASQVAAAAPGGAPMAADMDDDDDLDLGLMDLEDGPAGGGEGDRRVIVRRFMRGGEGGEGCGAMCGGKGRGMCGSGGKGGCGMGGGMGQGMHGGMGMGPGMGGGPGMLAHMTQALDLSDTQREKLAAIHERQQRRAIQARADLQIARLDLRKATTAEKPEAAAINTQIDRVAKLRSDMAKARVATMLEARGVLTPEQQKKMREAHMRGPGAGMPGMGRGTGMGPGGMGGHGMGMGMGPGGTGAPGMGHGGMPMHVKIERDTLIRR